MAGQRCAVLLSTKNRHHRMVSMHFISLVHIKKLPALEKNMAMLSLISKSFKGALVLLKPRI